jgi:hypothetical protein
MQIEQVGHVRQRSAQRFVDIYGTVERLRNRVDNREFTGKVLALLRLFHCHTIYSEINLKS